MDTPTKSTKLFISHASEDKADFVEPLVEALGKAGFSVWYDRFELTVGDSLLKKISQGLNECDYGVVVLSPAFFRKKWTQAELDGLFALETTERKVILPIWKDVTVEDVTAFSPMLAAKLGAPTTYGIDAVVSEVQRAVQTAERVAGFSDVENAISAFKSLDEEVGGTKRAAVLANSVEGVHLADEAAASLVAALRANVEQLAAASQNLRIEIDKQQRLELGVSGPYGYRLILGYFSTITNSISGATLRFWIYRNTDPWGKDHSKREGLIQEDFDPVIHHTGKLLWKSNSSAKEYTTEQLAIRFFDDAVKAVRTLHERNSKRG